MYPTLTAPLKKLNHPDLISVIAKKGSQVPDNTFILGTYELDHKEKVSIQGFKTKNKHSLTQLDFSVLSNNNPPPPRFISYTSTLMKSFSINAFFQTCFGLLNTFPFFNNNVGIAVTRQNVEQTTILFLGNYHLEQALQDLYCILAPTNICIRQGSSAHLLFKGSKYLSVEVLNFTSII